MSQMVAWNPTKNIELEFEKKNNKWFQAPKYTLFNEMANFGVRKSSNVQLHKKNSKRFHTKKVR